MFNLFNLFKKAKSANRNVSSKTITNIQAEWHNIAALLLGAQPSQLKQALISADKTLDNVLRDMVAGNTMGERLKAAKDHFSSQTYNLVWEAHKLRNTLVHESGITIPHHSLKKGVEDLKLGLKELGITI